MDVMKLQIWKFANLSVLFVAPPCPACFQKIVFFKPPVGVGSAHLGDKSESSPAYPPKESRSILVKILSYFNDSQRL